MHGIAQFVSSHISDRYLIDKQQYSAEDAIQGRVGALIT
jgi:hypothetical protein